MGATSGAGVQILPDLGVTFSEADMISEREGFVSHRVLPAFEVAHQAGFITKIPAENLIQKVRDSARAPGARYERMSGRFENDTYMCVDRGLEGSVDDVIRKNYAHQLDLDQIEVARVTENILLEREVRTRDLLFNATTFANYNTDLNGTLSGYWNSSAGKPIDDMMHLIRQFRLQCGYNPNCLTIGVGLIEILQTNSQIVDRLKYSGIDDPKQVTANQLAALFGIPDLIIGGKVENSGEEDQINPSPTFGDIWSRDKFLLSRKEESGDFKKAQLGRTMVWTDDSDLFGIVEGWRDEPSRSDMVRVRHNTEEKILYEAAGHYVYNVVDES